MQTHDQPTDSGRPPDVPEADSGDRRLSPRELAGVLDGIPNGIVVQDAAGSLIYANEVAARLAGYATAAEMLATPMGDPGQRFGMSDEHGRTIRTHDLPSFKVLRGAASSEMTLRFHQPVTADERWAVVQASPMFDPDGGLRFVVTTFRDITERKEDEERLRFLTTASEVLSSSLDYHSTLTSVAWLAVPRIADWCAIDMLGPDGSIERLTTVHTDPAKVAWATQRHHQRPIDPAAPTGSPNVIRTGCSEFIPVVSDELSASMTDGGDDDLPGRLGCTSVMIVPLTVHGRTLGAITFAAESGRQYTIADLQLAEDLARRAAIAVDNALLHRQAEEQRQQMRVTLSSIGDAVVATDIEGRITFMNPVAQRLTAWSLDEAFGRSLTDVLPFLNERTRRAIDSPVDAMMTTGRIMELTRNTVLIARDGRELPIDDSIAPIRDDRGTVIGAVLVFHDITTQRLAELERADLLEREKSARTEAEASENRYRMLVEIRPQLVWTARPDGSVDYLNSQWYDYTGQTPAEGENWGWQTMLHPDDMERAMESWRRSIDSGEPLDTELRIRRASDASYRWHLCRAVAATGSDGRISQWVGVSTDIEEQKQAEGRMEFLAEASRTLASSLDVGATLQRVADLAVPHIADWCAVDILEADGSIGSLAMAHADPAKLEWARELRRQFPVDRSARIGVPEVLRSGQAEFYPEITEEMIAASSRTEEEIAIARKIGYTSVMVVPLTVQGETIGTITFVSAESRKHYTRSDLTLAEDLARRAAIAIENARLYARAQQEIAERRRMEDQLRVSEVRFRALIDQSPLSIQIFDRDGNCVHANAAWGRLWGIERSLAIGYNIFGDEQIRSKGLLPHLQRAFLGETLWLPAIYYDPPEGGREGRGRWVRAFLYAIRNDAGDVHEVVLKLEDVTEWKKAEEALRESENRFRAMADNAPVLIWMAEPDTLCSYFNKEWLEFTGRSLAEEMGNGWTGGIHQEDRDYCLRTYLDAFGARRRFLMEYRLRRHDGEYRWMLETGTPRFTPDGEFAGYIGSCIDITDRKRSEIELCEAKEAAEAANEAKDQFLAVLSHELRTPLTPVLTVAQVLKEEEQLPEDLRSYIDIIHRNVELEARLIDDLLDLTRLEQGKLHLNLATVDAHALIDNVLQIYRSDILGKQLNLAVELRATRHQLNADPARLQQIVWNLVKNAVKFTDQGGSIIIRSSNDARGNLCIEVSDNGIGIEPERLPRIFDAFEQGEGSISRRYGGLGLGLAISKSLVDMHGGALIAHSGGRNQGSTFTIELAALPGESPVEEHPSAISTALTRRILLVDDHADTRKVMQALLERRGYAVTTAEDVRSGVEAAATADFDMLISDIGLPDGSGLDLIRKLAEHDIRLKAIALSGFGMEEDVRRSKEAGFIEHLTKPVSFGRLHEMIERILRS